MSEAAEVVVKVVEDVSKVAKPKKIVQVDAAPKAAVAETASSWLSTLMKQGSFIFVFWIGIVIVQGLFSLQASWTFNNKIKNVDATNEATKLKPNDVAVFDASDASVLNAKPGKVEDITSDHTTQDILKGKFGPVVLLIWAPYCHFCKDMMGAFEEAASKSTVPFVRVEGQYLKQVFKNYQIQGYPTIYGIDNQGKLVPFMGHRVVDNFVAFAKRLNPALNNAVAPVVIKPVEPPVVVQTVKVEVLDETEDKSSAKPEESENANVAQAVPEVPEKVESIPDAPPAPTL